ncbi:MAG: hypothetical protein RR557_08225 [Bacilli bacterium]
MTEDQLKDYAHDLYDAVLKTIRDFSDKVDWIVLDIDKFQIDIEELRALNPSAEKLALAVRKLSDLIKAIGNLIQYDYSVENIAINAAQSALSLELVARAIENNDSDHLKQAIEMLRQHS